MSEAEYNRVDIALAQLDTALRLWEEGSDYFSTLTLAGAAEEILGQFVQRAGGAPAAHELAATMQAFLKRLFKLNLKRRDALRPANWARNSVKHFDVADAETLRIDAREEAKDMLERAISNHRRLGRTETERILRFYESVKREPIPQLRET